MILVFESTIVVKVQGTYDHASFLVLPGVHEAEPIMKHAGQMEKHPREMPHRVGWSFVKLRSNNVATKPRYPVQVVCLHVQISTYFAGPSLLVGIQK